MNILKNIDFDILVIVHRIWIEGKRKQGGLDKIVDFFAGKESKRILLIEHPLYNEGKSRVSLLTKSNETLLFEGNTRCYIAVCSWMREIFFNLKLTSEIKGRKIFFASDPLNTIPAIIFSGKFSKKYYHMVDFAEKRFRSLFLNAVYHFIIKKALKKFDLIGVVSEAARNKIIQMGGEKNKIILIPNSPVFKEMDIYNKEENTIISTGGGVISKYCYEDVVEIMKMVKKKINSAKIYVVGGLEDKEYVQKIKNKIREYGLEKNFIFTGFLDKEQLEQYLKKTKVGIAFYHEEENFYFLFGDSLKMREYALFGIPTIADNEEISPGQEIVMHKAGFIVKKNEEAAGKIVELLTDEELYSEISKNAVSWAKANDKARILDSLKAKVYN